MDTNKDFGGVKENINLPARFDKPKDEYTDKDFVAEGRAFLDMIKTPGFALLYKRLSKQQEYLLERIVGSIDGESLEAIKLERENNVQVYRSVRHILHWIFGKIVESDRIRSEWDKSDKGGK